VVGKLVGTTVVGIGVGDVVGNGVGTDVSNDGLLVGTTGALVGLNVG